MKPGIAVALFISIILVGGAFWTRIDASRNEAGLIAVNEQRANEDFYKEVFLNPRVDTTPTSTSTQETAEPLTGTDLIGRQLILDYVDLAAMGQASDINVELLAERYAESIPTLINTQRLGYLDIKTGPNNFESIKNYSDSLLDIYIQHYEKTTGRSANNLSEVSLGSNYDLLFEQTAISSDITAERLKNLSAPLAIANLHLELINIHISNSITAPIVQKMDEDPLYAIAALTIFNQNSDKEIHILEEMGKIFKANGI